MTNEQLLALAAKWEGEIAVAYNEYSHGQRAGLEQAAAELKSLLTANGTGQFTTHEPAKTWEFDRYVNGRLMAEGVGISRAETFEEACRAAVALASSGSVLVVRQSSEPSEQRVVDWVCSKCQYGNIAAAKMVCDGCGTPRPSGDISSPGLCDPIVEAAKRDAAKPGHAENCPVCKALGVKPPASRT